MATPLSYGKQFLEMEQINNSSVDEPVQVYRINGYKKGFNNWEKVPIKIKVTQPGFGSEKLEIAAYYNGYQWVEISFSVVDKVYAIIDGEAIAEKYEFKCSCAAGQPVYFNF